MAKSILAAAVLALSLAAVPAHADVTAVGHGDAILTINGLVTCSTTGAVRLDVGGSSWSYVEQWTPGQLLSGPAIAAPFCVTEPPQYGDAGSSQASAVPQCDPVRNRPIPGLPLNALSKKGNVYTLKHFVNCGGMTVLDEVVVTVGASKIGVVHTFSWNGNATYKIVASLSRAQ
ncbi:MAG: hypothetical protein NVSMB57_06940 [Actinomycetota bacterium]